jgi:NIMA (never in mitosis gene a)-related kinase
MEFAAGGDLMKLINQNLKARTRIKEAEIWKALVDITRGLKSLHDKKILHRDLKAANIFVSLDGRYKLGDLNVSKVLKKGMAYTQTGTPYYASPEVWQDQPYDMKSDIWSLGCVIY